MQVSGIANNSGTIGTYSYDAWGNLIGTNTAGSAEDILLKNNPLRYRGYIYDTETGFYYLQSRYYDPEVGRFINADGCIYKGAYMLFHNMYTYCENNSIIYKCQFTSNVIQSSVFIKKEAIVSGVLMGIDLMPKIEFNLFGYELRTSAGMDYSPTNFIGRLIQLGFFTSTTHSEGREGLLYGFAGSTSDVMNFLDVTYFAGIGINLFDYIGAEVQIESLGVGAPVNLWRLSFGANINILGATSLTIAWNTELENGDIKTDCLTFRVNTGLLIEVAVGTYLYLTMGDSTQLERAFNK